MQPLNGIAPVILGFLSWGPRSGYAIKRIVDRSTRFFWAASFGSIYPQLRRLEEEGLIEGAEDPTGARQRKIYRLTPAGREALEAWLRSAGSGWELRDAGLLRVFFASVLPPAEATAAVRDLGAEHQRTVDVLREVREDPARPRGGYPELVLEFGIGLHEWVVDWSKRTEERLAADGPPAMEKKEAS
jgi:PadR family transcriptional regulator, regulatory protein AphA